MARYQTWETENIPKGKTGLFMRQKGVLVNSCVWKDSAAIRFIKIPFINMMIPPFPTRASSCHVA